MSEEFVNIELTSPMSDYALVIFHDTAETYPTETAVNCGYTITPSLIPSNRDWVGIYKVGWRSPRQYVCFDWSVLSDQYEKGKKMTANIIFPASSLPHDDGEYYQFCYVTSSGQVRGASTPFQFRAPRSDDFVEIEDEDEDILVIRTKSTVLQDKLSQAEREKDELSKTIEYLDQEKDKLLTKLIQSEKTIADLNETNVKVASEHKLVSESLAEQQIANKELTLLHASLQEKLSILSQEKESCVRRLDESDDYISGLQQQIKALHNEKDALAGENKSLTEEKELLKTHYANSEDQVKGYLSEMEDLRKRLREHEESSNKLRDEKQRLEHELTEQFDKVGDLQLKSDMTEAQVMELQEKLAVCENKLEAEERCKELLKEEVSSLNQTLTKLSADLEEAKSESHSYKTQLSRQQELVITYTEKINTLQRTLQDTQQELGRRLEDCKKLQAAEDEAAQQKEHGAQFALNKAYEALRQRCDKMRSQKEEAIKQLDEALTLLKEAQSQREQVETDMKERLHLGQEQYKQKVIECQQLQRELKRARKSAKTMTQDGADNERDTKTGNIVSEKEAKEVSCGSTLNLEFEGLQLEEDLREVVVEAPSLVEQTQNELQSQLTDLGHELERRQNSKLKYKKQYQEEKEKRSYMDKHYQSEIRKYEVEIDRLCQLTRDKDNEMRRRTAELQMMISRQSNELEHLRNGRPQMNPVPLPFAPQACFPPYNQRATYPTPHIPYSNFYPPQFVPMSMTPHVPVNVAPPVPPRQRAVATDPSPINHLMADSLTSPLLPLPRPLSPCRLSQSIITQVNPIPCEMSPEVGQTVESVDEEEERFHDARDSPDDQGAAPQHGTASSPEEVVCPICNMKFPITTPQREIFNHVDTHMEQVCPICSQIFGKDDRFEDHVNSHFTEI